MNRIELQETLRREHVQDRSYSLEAKNFDPDEALCLRQNGDEWFVFYSERGLQTGKRNFRSEAAACLYMLEVLRSDPTTKTKRSSGLQSPGDT